MSRFAEFENVVRNYQGEDLEEARHRVRAADVPALTQLYWTLPDWRSRVGLAGLIIDQTDPSMDAVLHDVLRAPLTGDDLTELVKADALAYLFEEHAERWTLYYRDREMLSYAVDRVLAASGLAVEPSPPVTIPQQQFTEWPPTVPTGPDHALVLAVANDEVEEVRRLLASGVDPDAHPDRFDRPLTIAARDGRADIVDLLLQAGADPRHGAVILAAAQDSGADLVRQLLMAGADPGVAKPDTGDTPLMIAAGRGLPTMVRLLLDAGADPAAFDRRGMTAADRARGRRADQVRALLTAHQLATPRRAAEARDVFDPGRFAPARLSEPILVAVAGNGTRAAVVDDRSWRLSAYDLSGGAEPAELDGHVDRISGIGISADGRTVVGGDESGAVRVWDLTGARPPLLLEGHTGAVSTARLCADHAVTGDEHGTVRVWDLTAPGTYVELDGNRGAVEMADLSPDGRRVAVGGSNGVLRVWDLAEPHRPRLFPGHATGSGGIHWTRFAGPRNVVTGGADKTVRLWNVDDGASRILGEFELSVLEADVDPTGRLAVTSCGWDRRVVLWDLATAGMLTQWSLAEKVIGLTLVPHAGSVTVVAATVSGGFTLLQP